MTEPLEAQIRAHAKKRRAHERVEKKQAREAAQLQRELARLARRAEKLWGMYGSRERVARLAGVHRVTVQTALRKTRPKAEG
jgi:hypothetical protein